MQVLKLYKLYFSSNVFIAFYYYYIRLYSFEACMYMLYCNNIVKFAIWNIDSHKQVKRTTVNNKYNKTQRGRQVHNIKGIKHYTKGKTFFVSL